MPNPPVSSVFTVCTTASLCDGTGSIPSFSTNSSPRIQSDLKAHPDAFCTLSDMISHHYHNLPALKSFPAKTLESSSSFAIRVGSVQLSVQKTTDGATTETPARKIFLIHFCVTNFHQKKIMQMYKTYGRSTTTSHLTSTKDY